MQYTTEWFIDRAKSVHGDKYDYSKASYRSYYTPVALICPEHGGFSIKPGDHLHGCGCPKCGRERSAKSHLLSNEEFIRKARAVHGDKYDYSKTVYKGSRRPVDIICRGCGSVFSQQAGSHLRGCGCPFCNGGTDRLGYTAESYIEKARKIHGGRYDYSKTIYSGSMRKITVTCPEHGWFAVRAADHLQGQGCPLCRKEAEKKEFLEKVHNDIEKKWRVKLIESFDGMYEYSPKKRMRKYLFRCSVCGNEWRQPVRFHRDLSCPKCFPSSHGSSKGELRLYNYFLTTGLKVLHNDRTAIAPKELDIWLPDLGFAIEYDGKYWHTPEEDEAKNKLCAEKGIRLYRADDNDFIEDERKVLADIKKFFGYDFQFKKIGKTRVLSNRCRRIICTDTMEIFPSYIEAMEHFGLKSQASLTNVCSGTLPDCHGWHFRWYDEGKSYEKTKRHYSYKYRRVRCIETGVVYTGLNEAVKQTGIAAIWDALNGRQKTAGGLHWEYTNDEPSAAEERIRKAPRGGKRILCAETDRMYSSGKELADELGVSKTAVYNAIKKKQKCRGYSLSYVRNDIFPSL